MSTPDRLRLALSIWLRPEAALGATPSTLAMTVGGGAGGGTGWQMIQAVPGGQAAGMERANPNDFVGGALCLLSDAPASDAQTPPLGAALHDPVRAQNPCPMRDGSLGTSSSRAPIQGRACPWGRKTSAWPIV